MDFLKDLHDRGILNAITNEEKAKKFFIDKKAAAYIGFDPTAASLHLGNYLLITIIKRLKQFGIDCFALVGGATGMIGDPSGKTKERQLLTIDKVNDNKQLIINQLIKLGVDSKKIIDNYDFYKEMNFLTFLRDVGKYVNINYLLEKEIIKTRLESGLSFTEFSYNLIQSYDFWKLYNYHNIHLQIGGSDQWGNITAGIELIRKKTLESIDNDNAVGLTVNLLTNSEGKKFGKSEQGAIFLDKNLTSPYKMYQYLINQPDSEVFKLIKALTFLSIDEINKLEQEHFSNPSKKYAQLTLAKEVVKDIHGHIELDKAMYISEKLFSGDIKDIDINDLKTISNDFENSFEADQDKYNILDLMVLSNIVKSKTQARELIKSGAITVNGNKINDEFFIIEKNKSFNREFCIIKKGKKLYTIIKWKNTIEFTEYW